MRCRFPIGAAASLAGCPRPEAALAPIEAPLPLGAQVSQPADPGPGYLVWQTDAFGVTTSYWFAPDGALERSEPGVVVIAGDAWRVVQEERGFPPSPTWAWRSDRGGVVPLWAPDPVDGCDDVWTVTVTGTAGSVAWWQVTDEVYCGDRGDVRVQWGAADLATGAALPLPDPPEPDRVRDAFASAPNHLKLGRTEVVGWSIDPRTGEAGIRVAAAVCDACGDGTWGTGLATAVVPAERPAWLPDRPAFVADRLLGAASAGGWSRRLR